jgi:hypothetical protein
VCPSNSQPRHLLRAPFVARLLALLLLATPAVVKAQFSFTNINGQITITGYSGSGSVVTIPSSINGFSVTSIGTSAFENITNITYLTIPGGVTNIGVDAFANCIDLANTIIPNSVISFGDGAFSGCTSLKSITIPSLISSIGFYVAL